MGIVNPPLNISRLAAIILNLSYQKTVNRYYCCAVILHCNALDSKLFWCSLLLRPLPFFTKYAHSERACPSIIFETDMRQAKPLAER